MAICHRQLQHVRDRRLICTVVVLALGGCSHEDKAKVSGNVLLDGVLIENGTIAFRPVNDDGPTAGGLIVAGRYELRVTPGKKKVEIQGFRKIGERKAMPGEPMSPIVPLTEPIVPAKYNTKTTLTADVTIEGKNEFEFALVQESKK
jgi:hypothetical protein